MKVSEKETGTDEKGGGELKPATEPSEGRGEGKIPRNSFSGELFKEKVARRRGSVHPRMREGGEGKGRMEANVELFRGELPAKKKIIFSILGRGEEKEKSPCEQCHSATGAAFWGRKVAKKGKKTSQFLEESRGVRLQGKKKKSL